MPFYTKYKDTTYEADLNSASTTYSPADSTNGRPCSTTQSDTGTRVASQYSANSNMIYTEVASKFTQIITLPNSYVKSWSVSRETSPEESATTGVIASGTTSGGSAIVYLNDTLTATATAPDTSYSDWNFTSLSAPQVSTVNGNQASIKNVSGFTCDVYNGSTRVKQSLANNSSYTDTGVSSSGTQYSYTLKQTQTRTKYTYSTPTLTWSSRTVTGVDTLTITGSRTSTTESGSRISSDPVIFTSPYSISVVKYDHLTLKVTYTDNNGTLHENESITQNTTLYGKKNSSYSWTATADTGYRFDNDNSKTTKSGSGTLISNISISPQASLKVFTVTIELSSTYQSTYRGTLTATNNTHSSSGWSVTCNGSTFTWTFTVYYGDSLSFSGTTYTSGTYTYTPVFASSSAVITDNYRNVVGISRGCTSCSATTTCGSSSQCRTCSAYSTCGSANKGGCTSRCAKSQGPY